MMIDPLHPSDAFWDKARTTSQGEALGWPEWDAVDEANQAAIAVAGQKLSQPVWGMIEAESTQERRQWLQEFLSIERRIKWLQRAGEDIPDIDWWFAEYTDFLEPFFADVTAAPPGRRATKRADLETLMVRVAQGWLSDAGGSDT